MAPREGFKKSFTSGQFFFPIDQLIISIWNPRTRSEPLAALLQVRKLSRPQVVKQLWVHIKGNQLQKPNDKRKIVCDEPMRAIFNTDEIDMFKMNKVLGQYVTPFLSCGVSGLINRQCRHLHEEGEWPLLLFPLICCFPGCRTVPLSYLLPSLLYRPNFLVLRFSPCFPTRCIMQNCSLGLELFCSYLPHTVRPNFVYDHWHLVSIPLAVELWRKTTVYRIFGRDKDKCAIDPYFTTNHRINSSFYNLPNVDI